MLCYFYEFLSLSWIPFAQVVTKHTDAWLLKDPVDAREVPDYYDIIKDPFGIGSLPFCGLNTQQFPARRCDH